VALAKGTIDSNRYMTLGTTDEAGHPWVSPVFYAARGYGEFYWMSSPEVTHSQNLARRPQLSIVIFDSQVVPGNARPVYMSAVAEMSVYRLYRSTVSQHSVLCPRSKGLPCTLHGRHSTTGPGDPLAPTTRHRLSDDGAGAVCPPTEGCRWRSSAVTA
jgi:hypothetical protein